MAAPEQDRPAFCMWIQLDGTRCSAPSIRLSPIGLPDCGQHGDGKEWS